MPKGVERLGMPSNHAPLPFPLPHLAIVAAIHCYGPTLPRCSSTFLTN